MIVSIIIAAFSFALLLYWFGIAHPHAADSSPETSTTAAVDSQFSCRQVKELLRGDAQLDSLSARLSATTALATYLIEHAAGLDLNSIEDRLLVLDYRIMQWYFRVTRSAAPATCAPRACRDGGCGGVLAGRLDERAGLQSEA